MKYIKTYLICRLSDSIEEPLRHWLDTGFYPNAIDRSRGRVIIFNISWNTALAISEQFRLEKWTFGNDIWYPEEYAEVFELYDEILARNVAEYQASMDIKEPIITSVLEHNGYRTWIKRYYLSRGLLGISTEDLRPSGYICCKREIEIECLLRDMLQKILSKVVNKVWMYDDCDGLKIHLWIDRNPFSGEIKKIHIGWFAAPELYNSTNESKEQLRMITYFMNGWLHSNGLTRNAYNQNTIKLFLRSCKKFAPELYKVEPTLPLGIHNNDNLTKKYIVDAILIPFKVCDEVAIGKMFRPYPTAIDYDKKIIMLFNIKSRLPYMTNLFKISDLGIISYEMSCPREYDKLKIYMEKKIEENLDKYNLSKECFSESFNAIGMGSYYNKVRFYKGLNMINANVIN